MDGGGGGIKGFKVRELISGAVKENVFFLCLSMRFILLRMKQVYHRLNKA